VVTKCQDSSDIRVLEKDRESHFLPKISAARRTEVHRQCPILIIGYKEQDTLILQYRNWCAILVSVFEAAQA
jgi:hypothetical protein